MCLSTIYNLWQKGVVNALFFTNLFPPSSPVSMLFLECYSLHQHWFGGKRGTFCQNEVKIQLLPTIFVKDCRSTSLWIWNGWKLFSYNHMGLSITQPTTTTSKQRCYDLVLTFSRQLSTLIQRHFNILCRLEKFSKEYLIQRAWPY